MIWPKGRRRSAFLIWQASFTPKVGLINLDPIVKDALASPLLEILRSLSSIPTQLSTDATDPIVGSFPLWHHNRKWISTGTNCDIISGPELNSLSTVKARPAACSRIVRDTYAEDYRVRENNWAEGERVRADSCDEDDWVLRMAQRTPRTEAVGS